MIKGHLRIVNWRRKRVWDFDQKRMVHWRPWGSRKEPNMPLIGFACYFCSIVRPVDHYLIKGQPMCEPCAVKKLGIHDRSEGK